MHNIYIYIYIHLYVYIDHKYCIRYTPLCAPHRACQEIKDGLIEGGVKDIPEDLQQATASGDGGGDGGGGGGGAGSGGGGGARKFVQYSL